MKFEFVNLVTYLNLNFDEGYVLLAVDWSWRRGECVDVNGTVWRAVARSS